MSAAVPLRCPVTHRTRPPELNSVDIVPFEKPKYSLYEQDPFPPCLRKPRNNVNLTFSAPPNGTQTNCTDMTSTKTPSTLRQQIAQVNTQPKESRDYSAYVPVKIGTLETAAYIDSGNTFANVISPETMTALGIRQEQLEPVPPTLRWDCSSRKDHEGLRTSTPNQPHFRGTPYEVQDSTTCPTRTSTSPEHLWAILVPVRDRSIAFKTSPAGTGKGSPHEQVFQTPITSSLTGRAKRVYTGSSPNPDTGYSLPPYGSCSPSLLRT